jgi:hypothetical protein
MGIKYFLRNELGEFFLPYPSVNVPDLNAHRTSACKLSELRRTSFLLVPGYAYSKSRFVVENQTSEVFESDFAG